MSRHYLDFASTAPLRPEASTAIVDFVHGGAFADPGRPYEEGRAAAEVVEGARDALAALAGVTSRQVVFTSGGTEAANWASFAARADKPGAPIAVCAVEHSAVLRSAERGGPVETIPVDGLGRVDLDALDDLLYRLGGELALVHCQLANHEVGTIQPAGEVVTRCREAGVPVHVDACAAVGQLPVDLSSLDADFVSISSHKFGGPPGVGALVLRRGRRAAPLLVGGDQERARRAGMESLLALVGLQATANALGAAGALERAAEQARSQSDRIVKAALSVDDVSQLGDPDRRLPHLVCFRLGGVEAEGVLVGLDRAGIAVHSGSACSSEAIEPSPVLQAMGVDADRSLRCSVGWSTSDDDVSAFESAFSDAVEHLRSLAR